MTPLHEYAAAYGWRATWLHLSQVMFGLAAALVIGGILLTALPGGY